MVTIKRFIIFLFMVSIFTFITAWANEGSSMYLWTMETQEEINTYGNDNTGTLFALESETVFEGLHGVVVQPNGKAAETKIALDLTQSRLQQWIGKRIIIINYYFPETSRLNPSMFFLGMADVTEGFVWVDGIFAKHTVKPGWNQVKYALPEVMSQLAPEKKYKIFLAFAGYEDKTKIPLTEKFIMDGISAEIGEEPKIITSEELIEKVPPEIKREVDVLLTLETDLLLEAVSKKTFEYFWSETNPENGLIKDRSTADSPCSIASVGFGLTAIPVAIEHKWITKQEGYNRVHKILSTFLNGGVEGKNGFFYHFVDMKTGKRWNDCELSSIDTALLVSGAIFAGEYFKGTEIRTLADRMYRNVNWQWMMNNGDYLSMGWTPENGFLQARWNSFSEGILAYVLAAGSPTYPVSARSWNLLVRPIHDNYINLLQEVLFVYQYPQVWIDFRDKEDPYANYWNNAVVATKFNRLFTLMNREFSTYDSDIWGLSAGDGPNGYRAYGASKNNHDGTIVPYAAIASMPFTPELSIAAVQGMLKTHGLLIWGRYGFVSGFNVDRIWYSKEHIGIDQGDLLLMIENYRRGTVWKYFMRNENIQKAMKILGFKNKKSAYAVTPQYLKKEEEARTASANKKAEAYRVKQTVRIDGDLNEWDGITGYLVDEEMNVPDPGLQRVDKNKQKLQSKFKLQWDEECLYVTAEVTDNVVVNNLTPDEKSGFYRTDSVEFYFDPGRNGSNAGLLKLAVLPFDTQGNVHAARHEDANPGPVEEVSPKIKVAAKRTTAGYNVEAAIPFEYLGLEPKAGITIGFCQTVMNTNSTQPQLNVYERTHMLAWNNIAEIWANPEYWGTLMLK